MSFSGFNSGGGQVFSYNDGRNPGIDENVTKAENDIVAPGNLSRLNMSDSNPWRPGYGTCGVAVVLLANYYKFNFTGKDQKFYRYTIRVTPQEKIADKKLKRLVQLFLQEPSVASLGSKVATDFKSTLICTQELQRSSLGARIQYKFEDEDVAHPNATTYNIALTDVKVLSLGNLYHYLHSANATFSADDKGDMIQALNIIVGHFPKMLPSLVSVGANKHFAISGPKAQSYPLGGGLRAWRGVFVSVRPATTRILYNVQVQNGAFFEVGPLAELIRALLAANNGNNAKLHQILCKCNIRVSTDHLPEKKNRHGTVIPRIRTIKGLALTEHTTKTKDSHPLQIKENGATSKRVRFWRTDKSAYNTVYEWFQGEYNRRVDEQLPVVNVGTEDDPKYLPVDVCTVLPGQTANMKLNAQQTAEMIKFAVRKPAMNAATIAYDAMPMLGLDKSSTLKSFGMSLADKLIKVRGRVLPSPKVFYRGNKSVNTAFGSWNMRDIRFTEGATLTSWVVLRIRIGKDALNDTREMIPTVDEFHKALNTNGMNVQQPYKQLFFCGWTPGSATISEVFKTIKSHQTKPQLVLVVLPSTEASTYNEVKLCGDTRYGLHTVCVVDKKFKKPNNLQYFANVALKFNMKLGGRNQALEPSKLGIVSDGRTMLMSVDVTHPSPESAKTAPSVVGIVMSIDKYAAQYRAEVSIQEPKKEMVSDLKNLTIRRLQRWQKSNTELPKNIIVYRDGVSEGQYDTVLREELPSIKAACREIYPPETTKGAWPHITVCIVGKRHHTRFYPTVMNQNVADIRSLNPKNGTIVDRGVTEAKDWDIYLQAHTALHGTARPAHFHLVHDEIFRQMRPVPPMKNAADIFEDLTHNLAYTFGRATKAVSISPPAYYADLVCDRARRWNGGMFERNESNVAPVSNVHEDVADSMWWL